MFCWMGRRSRRLGRQGKLRRRKVRKCLTREEWLSRRALSISTCICASRAGIFGNDRDGHAGGGARRVHGGLLYAEYEAGERQCLGDAVHSRSGEGWRERASVAIGAASVGSKGEAIAEIAAMKGAGIVAVSDDGKPIATAKLARQVMDYCRSLELPVIEHSEDVSLAAGAVMREGVTSTRLGLRGMPAAAESVCVARDVQLAELTGARLHVAHLSAKASLEQVRWAKSRGLRVSCEVTPHHFTLIDEDVQYDSKFR